MPNRAPSIKAKKSIAPRVEPKRESSCSRGYGHAWRKARYYYLLKHPLCVRCDADGRVTSATDVDHIVPHCGDKILFWESSNWQSLCKSCHSRKTATEDGGFGFERKS